MKVGICSPAIGRYHGSAVRGKGNQLQLWQSQGIKHTHKQAREMDGMLGGSRMPCSIPIVIIRQETTHINAAIKSAFSLYIKSSTMSKILWLNNNNICSVVCVPWSQYWNKFKVLIKEVKHHNYYSYMAIHDNSYRATKLPCGYQTDWIRWHTFNASASVVFSSWTLSTPNAQWKKLKCCQHVKSGEKS